MGMEWSGRNELYKQRLIYVKFVMILITVIFNKFLNLSNYLKTHIPIRKNILPNWPDTAFHFINCRNLLTLNQQYYFQQQHHHLALYIITTTKLLSSTFPTDWFLIIRESSRKWHKKVTATVVLVPRGKAGQFGPSSSMPTALIYGWWCSALSDPSAVDLLFRRDFW